MFLGPLCEWEWEWSGTKMYGCRRPGHEMYVSWRCCDDSKMAEKLSVDRWVLPNI